ncbi:MAG: TRAP transporter TatT component family protein [Spirochaetales bacterium]|nr:TRAP transporter TatT component family protein [Spirochaetales bacterium]
MRGSGIRSSLVGSLLVAGAAVWLLAGCSLNKLAVNVVAKTLSSGGDSTVFTGEEDPQLVKDSLPFAMKLYESLLEQTPENVDLLLTTGSIFAMYANAFIQTPAGMLPDTEFEQQAHMLERAKKMYLRGRGYLFRAMELRHPGFRAAFEGNQPAMIDTTLAEMDQEDVPFLFWTGASWLGAFSTNPYDMEFLLNIAKPLAIMNRALELDERFNAGTIHDTFISVYASLPPSLGGSEEKARYHFRRAVELSGGATASPYVALATTVCVARQDADEYRRLLHAALAIDPDADPANRLVNIITQDRARWLLEHIEDYFLLDEGFEEGFDEGEELDPS